MKRVLITGASGLIGWHAHARLHAANCAKIFEGKPVPYDIVALNHVSFDDAKELQSAVVGVEAILHFAGVNRGSDENVASANVEIALRLVEACKVAKIHPHIVYANSIHSFGDTVYGQSKRAAGDVFQAFTSHYTNLILPHIFGECARPFYNNVTGTLIHQLVSGENVSVNPDGHTQLLHAGEAAQIGIDAILSGAFGQLQPKPHHITVPNLFAKLKHFHDSYNANIYPDISEAVDLALFNSYRAATYPNHWPRHLKLKSDHRGALFEAIKSSSGGQVFLSTTQPAVTRGDHFHLNKVERFLVLKGEAVIRIRKVLSSEVWEYRVSGDKPAPIDMPTLHTHSIENVGDGELLTLFWTHDFFNPSDTDTYADKVLQ
ncbi:NAD-dependent epimerase/dehydratase family protein [Pseudopelagicola sp. nBUS_20]|uniref:polysaccharide biosynthesis C-terminal domain-containing protein n=1 Tax=Pseudopelagicola sp. nBUS_20 TaxID=3395317 RepID=UPI003EBD8CA7